MSETRFTPGPWMFWVSVLDRRQFIVPDADPAYVIAEMPSVDNATDQDIANGDLLIAAPDLYQALVIALDLIEIHDMPGRYDDTDRETIAIIRAARAKARGEAAP